MVENISKDKNFLQAIKLDISRSFSLVPYERLALHKTLGILKSEPAVNVLLKEIHKGPDIRSSALSSLVKFVNPKILPVLILMLNNDISIAEKFDILKYIISHGTSENIPEIIHFIDANIKKSEMKECIYQALNTLKVLGSKSDDVLNYLLSIITSEENDSEIKSYAIIALSPFRVISTFENYLKKEDDQISYAVFKSIYDLNISLTDSIVVDDTDEARLYTYSSNDEDKIFLDVRVLLGKITHKFDAMPNKTKVAFICAMISCNHREFLTYVLKALNSHDQELINLILFALYENIGRIRNPDNLFRSLISLTIEHENDNEIIINIFDKYFKTAKSTRQYNMLRDKLFSYIVVTLESYFETYRKEFMITGVIEKSFPMNFQRIRSFIIEKLDEDLKNKLVYHLIHEDPGMMRTILHDMLSYVKYISDEEKESLSMMIEILLDKDPKSREISASRIKDLNFEKRYLRIRIIRLCKIISKLNISEASSALVNIYNYLKKYPDISITDITINTLSILNYSYMLGEIEVQLNTGNEDEKLASLQYLSLYTEQRSLNILLDFVRNRINDVNEVMELAVNILIERDIAFNASTNQTFRNIIENNKNQNIVKLSVLGIGKCGFGTEIEFLDSMFYRIHDGEVKEQILKSIGSIITLNTGLEKRIIIKNLKEYLKDPGIKVRVYSCLLLVKLGYKEALKSIKDMLVIKNKSIQRDILTILGDLKSIELSFFLISLLKEEYGMTDDIISALELLPVEDLQEIDSFIVNMFKKFETPELDSEDSSLKHDTVIVIPDVRTETVTLLYIDIHSYAPQAGTKVIADVMNINIRICHTLIKTSILDNRGVISKLTGNKVIAFFHDPVSAIKASLVISNTMKSFRRARIIVNQIELGIQLVSDTYKFFNDEILNIPDFDITERNFKVLANKVLIDEKTGNAIEKKFAIEKVSEFIFTGISILFNHYYLLFPNNSIEVVNEIIDRRMNEEQEKDMLSSQLEAELKKLKLKSKSPSTAAIARDLENIGIKLNDQLKDIDSYIQKRSTDRELIKNVRRMLTNINNLYKVEISRIMID